MTALNLICQRVATATEFAALLFIAPAFAAAPAAPASDPAPRQSHALHSALELHWLGSLGGLRVVHALQNTDARSTAAPDDDSPCGGNVQDDDVEPEDKDNAHAVLNLDEALADLQQRPAGTTTVLGIRGVAHPEVTGAIVHVALSAARSESDALAFFLMDGAARYLAVVPPQGMRGEATLTVRLRRGASERVSIGRIDDAGKVILIPRAADDLAIEAIELEARSGNEVSWVTVPLQSSPRRPTSASLASVSR